MISVADETVVTLTEAARLIPRRRGGRPTNVSTLFRWTSTGCKGVKLDSIQIGGTRCTSREALQRFFDRLTSGTAPVPQTSTRRQRAIDSAKAELGAAGY